MPLLSPILPIEKAPSKQEIEKVLQASGLKGKSSKEDLQEILNSHGLSIEDIVENIGGVMRAADSSTSRLQAAKIAAELHGLLKKDELVNVPNVTIVIKDSQISGVNPILIPR